MDWYFFFLVFFSTTIGLNFHQDEYKLTDFLKSLVLIFILMGVMTRSDRSFIFSLKDPLFLLESDLLPLEYIDLSLIVFSFIYFKVEILNINIKIKNVLLLISRCILSVLSFSSSPVRTLLRHCTCRIISYCIWGNSTILSSSKLVWMLIVGISSFSCGIVLIGKIPH